MAIFNSYVKLPEGNPLIPSHHHLKNHPIGRSYLDIPVAGPRYGHFRRLVRTFTFTTPPEAGAGTSRPLRVGVWAP